MKDIAEFNNKALNKVLKESAKNKILYYIAKEEILSDGVFIIKVTEEIKLFLVKTYKVFNFDKNLRLSNISEGIEVEEIEEKHIISDIWKRVSEGIELADLIDTRYIFNCNDKIQSKVFAEVGNEEELTHIDIKYYDIVSKVKGILIISKSKQDSNMLCFKANNDLIFCVLPLRIVEEKDYKIVKSV